MGKLLERCIQLVVYKKEKEHVSRDTIKEFESARDSATIETIEAGPLYSFIGDWFQKLVIRRNFPLFTRMLPQKKVHRLCIMMGLELRKPFVPFLFNQSNHAYFFDAWPSNHAEIERFLQVMKIRTVFFSSAQVTDIFNRKQLPCGVHWVPEGISVSDYSFRPFPGKDIDVISFGRKHEQIHEKIVDGLSDSKISYLYEKKRGEIIFKDRSSFVDGLSRAKVSICVPSNISHPERAGEISTMTTRYLQSMASKTLVVGIQPEEMKRLFPYNPIIPIDMHDPLGHLKNILANYMDYVPLIERNYDFIKEHHSWQNRWSDMTNILSSQKM